MKTDESEFSYKHFLVDEGIYITIKESNSFIREGTTGLKLWPAAIKLVEFILINKSYFDGKSIIELGSGGSGLVGLTLLKTTNINGIFLSDCHEVVIQNLKENVNLNLQDDNVEWLETSILVRQRLKLNNSINFGILNLPWEEAEVYKSELLSIFTPHMVLATDIVYDETIFDPLLQCLNTLFNSNPLEFILSQTIRNLDTFQKFCELLSANSFNISEMSLDNENNDVKFPCDALSLSKNEDVRILKITKC